MKSIFWARSATIFLILILTGLLLSGCGGSSGGGSEFSDGSGTAAVFIADGPADSYNVIKIKVTEVLFLPPKDEPNRSPVVIFRSQDGHAINLLDYRDQDYLLTVKKGVPAGFYEKIRLRVADIQVEGGPCAALDIKLPSGKIDLNPRGGFEVIAGETISIRLDVDANKSINLHEAGSSGKCIFRPVVFVDIEPVKTSQRCPAILKGKIDRLIFADGNGDIEGFILDLSGHRGDLKVLLFDDTVIFDENGSFSGPDALEPGQNVRVRGRLTPEGSIQASVVVIGDVLILKGTVGDSVKMVEGQDLFPLNLDPGQAVVDDSIDVVLTNETLVLTGCDEKVSLDSIQKDMRAKVVGKLSQGDLIAVVVLLEPKQITGDLISIDPTTGGNNLTIKDEKNNEIVVFLFDGTPIYLEGNGQVSLDLLSNLVTCEPRQVRVVLDPEETDNPTAKDVRVQPEPLFGAVSQVFGSERIIVVDGKEVQVQPNATILAHKDGVDIPVSFDQIKMNDVLTSFGFQACLEDNVDFYAFIILIK